MEVIFEGRNKAGIATRKTATIPKYKKMLNNKDLKNSIYFNY